jgi:integrase
VRDLRSAVKRVAILLGDGPAVIPLDIGAIAARLAAVNPMAVGMSTKRFANIRSDFLAAVKASGVKPLTIDFKSPLSPEWAELFEQLSGRRAHIGLSRLGRYASARGIVPTNVNDEVITSLIASVREGSLHRKPNQLHRRIALIWNETASDSSLGLLPVAVPSFRIPKRINWARLPNSFRLDVDKYLLWCSPPDRFAPDSRPRALAKRTADLRRDHIHTAVTALVDCETSPSSILSLADLVSRNNFKCILNKRLDTVEGRQNAFNFGLGKSLLGIAREWVKVDVEEYAELKRLMTKMPGRVPGLTDKNKRCLSQFDDPAVLWRLYRLPDRLWAEVKRDEKPTRRTLAKAQVALAIAILSYAPLRAQNLTALAFDTHLFLREQARAVSTLEVPADEVKNGIDLAYDIPPRVAKMLIEYRDQFAPKLIGHRPRRLFVNVDGTPKLQATVSGLIRTSLSKRAGIRFSPHQFRHLCAKVVRLSNCGEFETIRQILGHKSLKTTIDAYAGIDSRLAARRHQLLIEQALSAQTPTRPAKRRRPPSSGGETPTTQGKRRRGSSSGKETPTRQGKRRRKPSSGEESST